MALEQKVANRHGNDPKGLFLSRSEYESSSRHNNENSIVKPAKEKARKPVEQKYSWRVDGVKVSYCLCYRFLKTTKTDSSPNMKENS